jgi:hypothetical protein
MQTLRIDFERKPMTWGRPEKVGTVTILLLGFMSCCFWWPTFSDVSRFAFLCYFPAIFPFCFGVVRWIPQLDGRGKRRIVAIVLAGHCALLAGSVFLWRAGSGNFNIRNPDFVFSFMAVEVALFMSVLRFSVPKTST